MAMGQQHARGSQPPRLFLVVAIAAAVLLALKVLGWVTGGAPVMTGQAPAIAQTTDQAADDKADAARGSAASGADKPDEKLADKPAEKSAEKPAEQSTAAQVAPQSGPQSAASGSDMLSMPMPPDGPRSEAQVQLIESLALRRRQIDERERALSIKGDLLKAAEKRVDMRIAELKSLEGRIQQTLQQQEAQQTEQFGSLVKMYTSMKPKEAAQIFNLMDQDVLLSLAEAMKPRIFSTILAQMDPVKAKALTQAMARKASQSVEARAAQAGPAQPVQRTAPGELPALGTAAQ